MRRHNPRPGRRRSGKVLVLLALLLPALLGMAGLVIDGGLLMAAQRQAQNAADAAALAAAMDKLRGKADSTATATATTFVKDAQYNNLPNATLALNTPPTSGPYAGATDYVEAVVTSPVLTSFIQVLGVNSNQQVQARAVAAIEAVAAGEGAIVLDPTAVPGLAVSGGGHLVVNGRVVINSQGSGVDEKGQSVDLGLNKYAATTGNGSTIEATNIQVVGGVDTPANFKPFAAGDPSPLHARALPEPDPLRNLPTPTTATPGVDATYRGAYANSNKTETISPGIYDSIKISNNANVTFSPGIYIIKMPSNGSNAISITGGATVRGDGVMFYNTGSDFVVGTGLPDAGDGDGPVGSPNGANFGDVTINGSNVQLTGLNNPQSPFNGMLFYQRRWNNKGADVQGSGANTKLGGTIYAKWSNFKLAGSGKYDAQFVVGSMALSGTANVTLNYAGKNLGKANQIFLVE